MFLDPFIVRAAHQHGGAKPSLHVARGEAGRKDLRRDRLRGCVVVGEEEQEGKRKRGKIF